MQLRVLGVAPEVLCLQHFQHFLCRVSPLTQGLGEGGGMMWGIGWVLWAQLQCQSHCICSHHLDIPENSVFQAAINWFREIEHFSAQTKSWTECWCIRKKLISTIIWRAPVFTLSHEESYPSEIPGIKQAHLCFGVPERITHFPTPGYQYNPTSKVGI